MTTRPAALAAAPARAAAPGALAASGRRRLADLVGLCKPRVVLMIALTTVVGFYVGAPGALDVGRLVHTLAGTVLAAAGTLALNQYLERDVDARMRRTARRPLPDGRLRPGEALALGALTAVTGLLYLALLVGPGAFGVTAAIAVLYLLVYTPAKRRTWLCTLVGAVAGALPPVAGWVAARGTLGAGAVALFAILFFWQLPHTLAIGRLYRDDYARAGLRILPVVDPDGRRTDRHIVGGCLGLLLAGALPAVLGLAGPVYLGGALVLGAGLLAAGLAEVRRASPRSARHLVLASVGYLPVLLVLMAVDKAG